VSPGGALGVAAMATAEDGAGPESSEGVDAGGSSAVAVVPAPTPGEVASAPAVAPAPAAPQPQPQYLVGRCRLTVSNLC